MATNRFPAHPAVDPSCPLCGGRSFVVAQDGERAVATLCTCVRTCPICRDTGWEATGEARTAPRRRCVCRRAHGRIQAFTRIGIPGRMHDRTRAGFKPSRANMDAFRAAAEFVRDFDPAQPPGGLVFWGDVGRGKTHLVVAILRELVIEHGVRARFVEFSHLLQDIKRGFDRGEGPAALLQPLVEVDVLAIDELGKGYATEFEEMIVDELVSRRYNAARCLLATTNYAPKPATGTRKPNLADPAATAPALVDRVGPRVYSRLQEMVTFVQIGGEDWRERSRRDRVRPG